jgi:ABC-type spermidine/putrescine transport system permease subunit I
MLPVIALVALADSAATCGHGASVIARAHRLCRARVQLDALHTVFTESLYWRTFVRTALISIFTTMLTLLSAFPVAWYIAKLVKGRRRSLFFLACLVPFWVSELVRTYGWMILLRESGVLSGILQWSGLAVGPVEMLYNDVAIMVGLVYASILFMLVPLVTTLVASCVTILAASLATLNAFLFERYRFPGKNLLFILMLLPLVIPGVILGISILIFASRIANYFDFNHDILLEMLRPGFLLVVLGQFAFLSTIATLVISARLRTFDVQLEEAARNLGALQLTAIVSVTLPFWPPRSSALR